MKGHAVVSGGAGFVGSHLVDRLLGEGLSVTVYDNFVTGEPRNLVGHRLLDLQSTDVSQAFSYEGPKIDYVFHLADLASPAAYRAQPLATLRAALYGVHNMLELARGYDARFLLASSSEVYGDPLVHPQPESYWGNVNPVGERSMYAEGKRFAEATAMVYARRGLPVRIARPFNCYGPRLQPADGRVVPQFVRQALTGAPLTVGGDGSHTRILCYISDLVEGLTRLFASRWKSR